MDGQLKAKILELLDQHRIMTIATLRPDGWPQATTVGYVSEGLTLYFLCGRESQKAANIARDRRVSLTVDHDTDEMLEITGLSMAAHATIVENHDEAARIIAQLPSKYPADLEVPFPLPEPEQVTIVKVEPVVISVLDYTKGFAHTDLVAC